MREGGWGEGGGGGLEVVCEILVKAGTFSLGVENLLRSDLDHSNLFQS